ncbi:MAG TPA: uroporphyrinogen-III C-methyltransferase [Ardenticatenaceae bacterium]|jgi:uroporphyrinogen III methyltransferase/synthase
MNHTGKVYLIGAGPGDPGLLTLKGAEALRRAEVIVYDRLANPALLKLASPNAERIYAGKLPDHHTLTQDEINAVLVEKGLAGRTVARLKGGDPYVFGRGGEEAEALRAAGIPFEVVPGVTSAIAAPAYAGVPVTHRDECSAFVVITGHEDPTKEESSLDYDALARFARGATLVFLMGVRRLPQISAALQAGGLLAETPVAVVQWGTLPQQRVATGTLATIADEVKRQNISSPAVTVVGGVVNYRDALRWFDLPEEKPLLGKRIVVTRARAQASELSEALRDLGAEPIEVPAIRITEPEDGYAALDAAIAELESYDWVVFTSINGVDHFWQRLRAAGRDSRVLGRARVAAIGTATAEALETRGIVADVVPEQFVAESLLDALSGEEIAGKRFLLPRADIAREALYKGLQAAGARVTEAHAYRTLVGEPDAGALATLDEGVDIITFTSSSTVRNFVEQVGAERAQRLAANATIAAIGPITASTARELGLRVDFEAEEYTVAGLVQAIVRATTTGALRAGRPTTANGERLMAQAVE